MEYDHPSGDMASASVGSPRRSTYSTSSAVPGETRAPSSTARSLPCSLPTRASFVMICWAASTCSERSRIGVGRGHSREPIRSGSARRKRTCAGGSIERVRRRRISGWSPGWSGTAGGRRLTGTSSGRAFGPVSPSHCRSVRRCAGRVISPRGSASPRPRRSISGSHGSGLTASLVLSGLYRRRMSLVTRSSTCSNNVSDRC